MSPRLLALAACLTRVLEQTTPPILLIQDGAQDHPSAARQRFFARHTTRLTVFPWPSASPADHPIEKRWKKVHPAGPHRPYCPTFEALTDKGEPALLKLAHAPEEKLSLGPLPTDMAKAA